MIDTFEQPGTPEPGVVTYTIVFNAVNQYGDSYMLRMPNDNRWRYGPILFGEYHRGEPNEHLGERTSLQALGEVVLDRLNMRLR